MLGLVPQNPDAESLSRLAHDLSTGYFAYGVTTSTNVANSNYEITATVIGIGFNEPKKIPKSKTTSPNGE
jgi:hypothetical protein